MAPIVYQDVVKEYKKNPDMDPEDIQTLMDWIQKQPHLPNLTALQTILFFHSCEYKMEFTKTVIDLNYTMRTHAENIFKVRDVLEKKVQHTLETILLSFLPKMTPEGHRVIYLRLIDYEPKNFLFVEAVKCFTLLFDLIQWEEGSWPGFVIIIDMDQVVLSHLARLDLMTIKQVLLYLQEAIPCRLAGFHFMNAPSFMERLMSMLRPFIKKEMMDLLHIHCKPNTDIYKYVPKQMFPKEAGGEHYSFDKIKENVKSYLLENKDLLIEEEKQRVNESLRPGKPQDLSSIFGVEGSFKKLDID